MNTQEKLNQLFDLRSAKTALDLQKQDAIDKILTPEIKAQLQDIDAEYLEKYQAVDIKIADLEAEIKNDVLAAGETIKGEHMMAMFVKGRTTWDTKALEVYSLAHPEIAALRKTGEPSVTIKVMA